MAKYTNADCKLCRREGAKLFLKGERCTTKKCAMEKRPVAPGMHLSLIHISLEGLKSLHTPEQVAALRGKTVEEILG